jgi:hypothetical protein
MRISTVTAGSMREDSGTSKAIAGAHPRARPLTRSLVDATPDERPTLS